MADKNIGSNGKEKNTADPNDGFSHSGERYFEIRVESQLDSQWSEWLEGLEMKLLENGEMILLGPIVDQAALMGVLNKLQRLNLTILSLNEVKKKDQEETK